MNENNSPPFKDVFDAFLDSLHSMQAALPATLVAIQAYESSLRSEAAGFLKKFGTKNGSSYTYKVDGSNYLDAGRFQNTYQRLGKAQRTLIDSLYVGAFACYDAYVRSIVAFVLTHKPEIRVYGGKQISADEALQMSSMDELRARFVEDYIDDLMRESYAEQFRLIRERFGITLSYDNEDFWPQFVEASQRRHLIVHCDSKVSRDYRKVCDKAKYKWPGEKPPEIGSALQTTAPHLTAALDLITEVGLKFGHAVIGQLFKEHAATLEALHSTQLYGFLEDERWGLAQRIGESGLKRKFSSDESRRRLVVNTAQAYKWDDNSDRMEELIKKEDWSAVNEVFQIAVSALRDEHAEVARLIERQLHDEKARKEWRNNIVCWPLFRQFRNTAECKTLIESKCGGDMESVIVPRKSPFKGLAALEATEWHVEHLKLYVAELNRLSKKGRTKQTSNPIGQPCSDGERQPNQLPP